jgi:mersacidin/lichenicidin family type 2 lantibiotic
MKLDIARAWKDEAYRQSLSSEELAMLPENPVGELELTDTDLAMVYGGERREHGEHHHRGGHHHRHDHDYWGGDYWDTPYTWDPYRWPWCPSYEW